MTWPWRWLVMLALSSGVARADGSLRCGGRLVSVGDARIDLLGRCGEPTFRERRIDERWEGVTVGAVGQGLRTTSVVEDWSYDFGPGSFVHVVTLVNGRITAIEFRSYGYADAGPKRPCGRSGRARGSGDREPAWIPSLPGAAHPRGCSR